MSFFPDPEVTLREAARRAAARADAELDAARRGSGNTHIGELTTGDLQLLEARRELQQARDRMRHLEQALRAAGRVLQPYLGNGRS
jgi:hypothetical protein